MLITCLLTLSAIVVHEGGPQHQAIDYTLPKSMSAADRQISALESQQDAARQKLRDEDIHAFSAGTAFLYNLIAQPFLVVTQSTPDEIAKQKATLDDAAIQMKNGHTVAALKGLSEVGKWAALKTKDTVSTFKNPSSTVKGLLQSLNKNAIYNYNLAVQYQAGLEDPEDLIGQLGKLQARIDFLETYKLNLPYKNEGDSTPSDTPNEEPGVPANQLRADTGQNSDASNSPVIGDSRTSSPPQADKSSEVQTALNLRSNAEQTSADLQKIVAVENWLDLGDRSFDIPGDPAKSASNRDAFYQEFPSLRPYKGIASYASPRSATAERAASAALDGATANKPNASDPDCIKEYLKSHLSSKTQPMIADCFPSTNPDGSVFRPMMLFFMGSTSACLDMFSKADADAARAACARKKQ